MTKREKEKKFNLFVNDYQLSEEEAQKYLDVLDTLDKKKTQMGKQTILEYAKKIKPVLRGSEKAVTICPNIEGLPLFWIESTQISRESCTYKAKPIREAVGLKEVRRITSYHSYGSYPSLLRPSADEAIWQCPDEIIDNICAFEFYTPSLDVGDVYNLYLDRHVLTTIYYEGVVPNDILSESVVW